MGEVIQLQGDQRKDVQEFLVDKKDGLELDAKTIKVCTSALSLIVWESNLRLGSWFLSLAAHAPFDPLCRTDRSPLAKRSFLTSC